jgi:hypothetical protein
MSTPVVMVEQVLGEDGKPWRIGGTYFASDSYASYLIGRGDAYAADGSLPDVGLTAAEIAATKALVSGAGTYVNSDGALYGLSETTPYVTLTATGTAFSGSCEMAGWYCSVAAGNITIYDALSATGTPIVPATALVAGPMPIFGAGTTGKLVLNTGCHVVLSGAATVRVLVG